MDALLLLMLSLTANLVLWGSARYLDELESEREHHAARKPGWQLRKRSTR